MLHSLSKLGMFEGVEVCGGTSSWGPAWLEFEQVSFIPKEGALSALFSGATDIPNYEVVALTCCCWSLGLKFGCMEARAALQDIRSLVSATSRRASERTSLRERYAKKLTCNDGKHLSPPPICNRTPSLQFVEYAIDATQTIVGDPTVPGTVLKFR